jgi:hypothetical protein
MKESFIRCRERTAFGRSAAPRIPNSRLADFTSIAAQAWDNAFTSLVEVWPTPRAGYWHVWMRGPQSAATEEPLPGDLIPALLDEWRFAAELWRNWQVNPQPTNPGLRQWPTIRPPSGPKRKQSYVR